METKNLSQALQAKKAKDRSIAVTVKAKDLYDLGDCATKSNIDANVKLKNNKGKESGYGHEKKNFKTKVYLHKLVTWTIESRRPNGKDKGYIVTLEHIDNIKHNFFSKKLLRPTGSDYTKISAEVVNNPGADNEDVYEIKINVTNTHQTPPNSIAFIIDPKLAIQQ